MTAAASTRSPAGHAYSDKVFRRRLGKTAAVWSRGVLARTLVP